MKRGRKPIRLRVDVIVLYRRGYSLRQIAARAAVSVMTVHSRLVAASEPRRPRGGRAGSSLNPAYVKDVEKRLKRGSSICEIALHYGVTRQAISELAKSHGFPVRELRRAGAAS